MGERAEILQQQLSRGIHTFCGHLVGRASPKTTRAYALAEAPLAAVRRHVEARDKPPSGVDCLIEETYKATLLI